jgi:large subunit ribosomal protein L9
LEDAKSLVTKLTKQSFTINAAAGPDEKLYGSVTAADIAAALAKEGIEVDRRKIVLEHPIRTTGVFDVDVKLHHEVATKVKVWVVAAEGTAGVAEAAPAEKTKKSPKKK